MSKYEFDPHRENFAKACERLGWKLIEVEVQHERDWDCKWTETHIVKRDGTFLIGLDDMSESMMHELISLSQWFA